MAKILGVHTQDIEVVGSVGKSSTQLIPNTGIHKVTSWGTPTIDTNSFWDAANSRWVIGAGYNGFYKFTAGLSYASNTTGFRSILLYKNGSPAFRIYVATVTSGNSMNVPGNFPPIQAVAGDYFEIFTDHNGSTDLNTGGSVERNFFGFIKIPPEQV